MADEVLKRDANAITVAAGVSDDASLDVTQLRTDPTTKRLKVQASIDTYTAVTDGEAVDAADTGTLILGTDGANYQVLKVNSDGELAINLETSDIEIGAVEIKNASTDDRVDVSDANTARTIATHVLATQNIDASGAVNTPVTNAGTFAVQATCQTNSGVDIGDVTINNASGASAVNIQDGGNTITVDGTVAVTGTFWQTTQPVSGTFWQTTQPVSIASMPSTPVTGTFYQTTQPVSVASAQVASGAIASGAVASGAIASGAVASGAFASGSIAAGAVVAGATSFVKLEDVGSANADAGVPALAVRKATPANTSGTDGDYEFLQMSAGRLWTNANLDTLISGEDQTNNVLMTEQQFSYSVLAADGQIKAGAGFVHSMTFQCMDAAPTAGTIILWDNTAESGTAVFTFFVTTTPFNPFTVILDVKMPTGIYMGFTTTADVSVTTSYR